MFAEHLDLAALKTTIIGTNTPARLLVAGALLFLVYVFIINELVCYKRKLPWFGIPPVLPLVGNLHHVQSNDANSTDNRPKSLALYTRCDLRISQCW